MLSLWTDKHNSNVGVAFFNILNYPRIGLQLVVELNIGVGKQRVLKIHQNAFVGFLCIRKSPGLNR